MPVREKIIRLATRVIVVAPMTFMMTEQRTRGICNPKFIVIFARLEKFKGPIRLRGCEVLSFHWIRETFQIEVIILDNYTKDGGFYVTQRIMVKSSVTTS